MMNQHDKDEFVKLAKKLYRKFSKKGYWYAAARWHDNLVSLDTQDGVEFRLITSNLNDWSIPYTQETV